jgi:hypothetical protein
MSDVLHNVPAAADPPTSPDTGPTPTVTHYQQVAFQVSATLNAAAALIASFESPHSSTLGFVRSHQAIPTDFIATAITAVEATAELQSVNKFDVTEARDVLQFMEAFRPVVDQLEALRRDLQFTIDARKAKVAADGLQIYAIAKGVARDPSSAAVLAHISNLKRDLGRARPKSRVPAPSPTPSPAAPQHEVELKKAA